VIIQQFTASEGAQPHVVFTQLNPTQFKVLFKAYTPAMPVIKTFMYTKAANEKQDRHPTVEKWRSPNKNSFGKYPDLDAVTTVTMDVREWVKKKPIQ
jgi:hypothetical protein